MRFVGYVIGVLALCIACAASAAEVEQQTERGEATRQQLKAQLDQLAVWVSATSGGKSTLMIVRTQSANPTGNAVRRLDWGDIPFVQMCPVSKLFRAKLGALGEGTVMGTVTLLETEGAGVYLIFMPRGATRGRAEPPTQALLVSLSVDRSGAVVYSKHLEAKRLDQPFSTVGDLPVATIDHSGLGVTLRMRWDAETYAFTFEPSVMYV